MNVILLLFEIETAPASIYWMFFSVLGVGGFFLVRLTPLFLLPVLAVIFFIFWALTIDINDPTLGRAIIKQEGYFYIVQIYITMLVGPIVLSLAGLPAWVMRRKRLIKN